MKNSYKILIIFVLLSGKLLAQEEIGKIKYSIKTSWVSKYCSLDYYSEKEKESFRYRYGKDYAYTYSSTLIFNKDSSYYFEKEEDNYSKDEIFKIYRDFNNNTTCDYIFMLNKLYLIKDSITYPKWKILNDIKEIAGHICMNAYYYDSIKSQSIVAWFALDIQKPLAPERFGGLPGAILEVDINNGTKTITAEKIEIQTEKVKIKNLKQKGKIREIKEEEYKSLIKAHMIECRKMKRPYFYGIRY